MSWITELKKCKSICPEHHVKCVEKAGHIGKHYHFKTSGVMHEFEG